MVNTDKPDTPSPISHFDGAPSGDFRVDCQCDLTPKMRWQMALLAAIGIAIVSIIFFGIYYLDQLFASTR